MDELINIKLEPFEELLTSNTQLRSSADITVQEILDWAKTFKIPQSAVNELLQILKIKRIKTEIKSETPVGGAASSSLQQRKTHKQLSFFLNSLEKRKLKLNNLFSSFIYPTISFRFCFMISFSFFHFCLSTHSIRICRSLLENLSTAWRHGAQSDESNDDTRAKSRYEKYPATEDSKHKSSRVATAEMRVNPAGNHPEARTTSTASLQNCKEGLRKGRQLETILRQLSNFSFVT